MQHRIALTSQIFFEISSQVPSSGRGSRPGSRENWKHLFLRCCWAGWECWCSMIYECFYVFKRGWFFSSRFMRLFTWRARFNKETLETNRGRNLFCDVLDEVGLPNPGVKMFQSFASVEGPTQASRWEWMERSPNEWYPPSWMWVIHGKQNTEAIGQFPTVVKRKLKGYQTFLSPFVIVKIPAIQLPGYGFMLMLLLLLWYK